MWSKGNVKDCHVKLWNAEWWESVSRGEGRSIGHLGVDNPFPGVNYAELGLDASISPRWHVTMTFAVYLFEPAG